MNALGVNITGFDKPVCNSFEAVVRDDQLCYEVDLERYKDKLNIKNQLERGLAFVMDYNEDRQVFFKDGSKSNKKHARIFIESTGNFRIVLDLYFQFFLSFRPSIIVRRRGIQP